MEKRREKDTRKRVLFKWEGEANNVLVAGSFNDWQGCRMRPTENGSFVMTIPLDPGVYQYKFVVDGRWVIDDNEETVTDNSGNINNVLEVGKPGAATKGKGKGAKVQKEDESTEGDGVGHTQARSKQQQQQQANTKGKQQQQEEAKTKGKQQQQQQQPQQPQQQQQQANTKGKQQQQEEAKTKGKQQGTPKPGVTPEVPELSEEVTLDGGSQTQVVNPWDVVGGENGIDYDRLIREFGTERINEELLKRFEKVTGKPVHPWLKRELFFSHRSLNEILDAVERGEPFFLYTGRGPSSEALHLGHLMPFIFTKWLQDIFDVPLVIQLTDDEKFLWKDISFEDCRQLAIENAKDIIACGFDIKKTFIFRDTDYISHMFPNILKIQKCITSNQVRGIFGFDGSSNIGKYMFPAIQAAPSFSSTFPHIFGEESNYHCLIPCAIDQDPFFRMTRDVAPRLHYAKPAVIHSKFFPALQGPQTKMSASVEGSSIFITDSPEVISKKISNYAFTGGRATLKEHQEKGGDLSVDVPYQYLRVFEFDDKKLKYVGDEFSSGRMSSGEIKKELEKVLVPLVLEHQKKREEVTEEVVLKFMEIRPLEFKVSKKK